MKSRVSLPVCLGSEALPRQNGAMIAHWASIITCRLKGRAPMLPILNEKSDDFEILNVNSP